VVLDLPLILAETTAALRAAMASEGGLAPGDILISCTHTHNAPAPANVWFDEEPSIEYLDSLRPRLVKAMRLAADRLEPVELRHGRATTHGVTFNRRPMYLGNEVGTHGPMWVDDFVGIEGPADDELQLLLASRPDGSVAGGLVNFACHL